MAQRTDIGKTVRQWKVRFNGAKGKSIEEFLQRIAECRRLTPLTDDDMLNAMTELLDGVALHWYRLSRKDWQTWEQFCQAARSCYGVDRRFQAELISEAQRRTQAKREPTRDYVFCLLTILNRFEEPWTDDKQLALIYRNLLPEIQKLVPREKITSVNRLIDLAREAECVLDAERNYKPPPSPEECIMPEVAFHPANTPRLGSKPKIAAVDVKSPDLKAILREVLQEVTRTDKPTGTEAPDLAALSAKRNHRDARPKSPRAEKATPKASPKSERKPPFRGRLVRKPVRDHNKDRAAGPDTRFICWGCSWPGYTLRTCPECAGNGKKGE